MTKIDKIQFNDQSLDVYGSVDSPYFLGADVARIIDYSNGKTGQMIEGLEIDEYQRTTVIKGGQRRSVLMISELGLYNVLSQSRKPIARMWRRVVHEQLIASRRSRGLSIVDQFDEWDDLLDTIYIDPETGILMQSVTVAGGDVEQVPYKEEAE